MGSALLPALSLSLAAAVPGQFSSEAVTALKRQEPQRVEASQAALMNLRGAIGLNEENAFVAGRALTDEFGQTHTRFTQMYQGVKVYGGEMIAHMDARGRMLAPTDAAMRNIRLNVQPSLQAGEAIAVANRELAPKGPYATAPKAELVIFPITTQVKVGKGEGALSYSDEVVRYALAYHVHTELENGTGETAHTDFMIDAHTGGLIQKWSTLETAAATGTGTSQYSGTVSINTNTVSGGYEMRDTVRGMNFDTRNLNHATSGNGTTYTDADNAWGDGANYVEGSSTTAANGETAAVDAHYGVGLTYDYYKNIHNRNGIDGSGTATYSRVHYSNSYDNAFWSDTCFCMTYGDGGSFLTLTSIDVAGHEMSHGVCARTAGLGYSGDAGGLNEGNSDINGTMVEFMAHGGGTTTIPAASTSIPTTHVYWTGSSTTTPSTSKVVPAANYLIGEQLATASYTHPLRFMYKPSLDGASLNSWAKSTSRKDPHYTSGVANHFFFLLAHGSQIDTFSDGIQSPMANGITSVTGIGNDHAARIWYRALSTYFTSTETYAKARTATLQAAADLYGTGSTEYASVGKAWTAVNVN
jgi:Zn-dependent metalloprotease